MLLRKIGLLRDAVKAPLAGRMLAVLDLASRLPRWVWYDADPNGHDARFWDRLAAAIPTGALVVFDLGFTDFARWATLTARGVSWLTRAKKNLKYDVIEVIKVLVHTPTVQDRIVWIGEDATRQRVRLFPMYCNPNIGDLMVGPTTPIHLTPEQSDLLHRIARRRETPHSLVLRIQMILQAAQGFPNKMIGGNLGVHAISIDEKTGIQALERLHPTRPPCMVCCWFIPAGNWSSGARSRGCKKPRAGKSAR